MRGLEGTSHLVKGEHDDLHEEAVPGPQAAQGQARAEYRRIWQA